MRKRVLLALIAAAVLAGLVVVVGVFWFGWYETARNRELLDSLPVFPGADATQDHPHPYESDENPLSPPDKWVILRTYRVPDGTTKEDVAAFYMERMPTEWERCLRHSSTHDSVTGRKGVLFRGAAFYLERTYVSVAVLGMGASRPRYDVFLDRHRNMRHDPCEPQPFTTDPACYDLEPPAGPPQEGTQAQRFYRPGDWSNTPPDTPVWVVEIKGVSQYLGSDSEPWQYVMHVLHAESGSSMEGARYLEPRLAPAVRDGS